MTREVPSSRAWQVLIEDAVLSGGDWPGDYRYWVSEDGARAHANAKINAGWKKVRVVEVDPPLHENMFPSKSCPQVSQDLYTGPRGGRFTYGRTRDGVPYRRYF